MNIGTLLLPAAKNNYGILFSLSFFLDKGKNQRYGFDKAPQRKKS